MEINWKSIGKPTGPATLLLFIPIRIGVVVVVVVGVVVVVVVAVAVVVVVVRYLSPSLSLSIYIYIYVYMYTYMYDIFQSERLNSRNQCLQKADISNMISNMLQQFLRGLVCFSRSEL